MGPYCNYCGNRCFLLRVTADGRTVLLATCQGGMAHDLKVCGQTHLTAVNPVLQPRAAALLGAAALEQSCHEHGAQHCRETECLEMRVRMRATEPGPADVAAGSL
jgi:hypothetical protein